MRRLKAIAANLALVVGSLLVTALVAEAVLRVAKINNLSSIRVVRGKGILRVPGAPYVWRKEGFSEGRFNSHGFRDYERTLSKPPGVFRIGVFGDSYTEALQVPLEDSFPALLEKMLNNASSGRRYEVLNFGQSGFGTADEYSRWLNYGLKYHLDLVVVAFYPGNDVRNNSQALNTETTACYFDRHGGDKLVLDCSMVNAYVASQGTLKKAWQWLTRRSYLASLLSERLYLLRLQIANRRHRSKIERAEGAVERGSLSPLSDLNVYLEDPPTLWKEAFGVTESALVKFASDVRAQGEEFALVTLSTPEQVDPVVQSRARSRSGSPLDFDRPERTIAEFARAHGIPCLELGTVFRNAYESTGQTLHGEGSTNHGHWNKRGHALAASKIFQFLTKDDLVPSSGGTRSPGAAVGGEPR